MCRLPKPIEMTGMACSNIILDIRNTIAKIPIFGLNATNISNTTPPNIVKTINGFEPIINIPTAIPENTQNRKLIIFKETLKSFNFTIFILESKYVFSSITISLRNHLRN